MWEIKTTDRFDSWFDALDDKDRTNVIASMLVLARMGPRLSRPYADTVYDSIHSNLKELRVQSKGKPLRIFFAFDLERTAILLCGRHKSGKSRHFYREMISTADHELSAHQEELKKGD